MAGAVVAAYLLYLEKSGVMAARGPFGDCNAVLHSKHAVMFGLLPVSAIGLLGYSAMIVAWIVTRRTNGTTSDLASLCVFGIASTGTALTIYLVYVQPFVIGASCAWCLTSAIIITILMWLSAPSLGVAWSNVYATLPRAIDSNLAGTIRRQLRSKILPSYNEIEVAVRRRRVTLGGRVYAACHSDFAEHIASTVEGVRTVDNSIEIIQSEDSRLEWCGRITQQPFTLHQTARGLRPVISRVRKGPLSDQDPGGSQ
ncbi:vitamin K epoxide reductase family protein [Gemmatimonadota bacterium]